MRLIDADNIAIHILRYADLRDCPTVDAIPLSVIEDIKAEIKKVVTEEKQTAVTQDDMTWVKGLNHSLKIIDKHISGKAER